MSLPRELDAGQLVDEGTLSFAERRCWPQPEGERDLDLLTVEEPLEIRLGTAPLAVVMRTPGNDEELALGFALTEGIVSRPEQIQRAVHCTTGEHSDNVISLIPDPSLNVDPERFRRNLYTTSSCGICGKRSIEQALLQADPIESPSLFSLDLLRQAPTKLTDAQASFHHSGACHGAGLMDASGALLSIREDIGRHNAVDKVIGWAAQRQIPLSPLALIVSGRASYEIIQKALFARISCVVSIGGVSSLAVDLAKRSQISLVGFARHSRLSIYVGKENLR